MKKLIAVFGVLAALAFAVPAFAQYAPTYPYPAPAPAYSCPQLTYNLYRGVRDAYTGGQVTQLQQFLAGRYGNQLVTGYFGSMTSGNVALFQREQSVYPAVGFVGPLTRAAIASVCGGTVYPPPTYGSISITNISGPNSLAVGQQATWSITTNAPYGSYLSTSVRWGDENIYGYPYGLSAANTVSQNTSLTHSYSQAGTYTITFTVSDSAGHTASATATVVVGGTQNTSATFSAYPTSGTAPLNVSFSAGSLTANATYYINYGDGTNAQLSLIAPPCYYGATSCPSSANASHTYTAAGTYTAELTYQPSYYCPSGAMCPQMMPAPQVVGTVTIIVSGSGTGQYSVNAYPTSGSIPLTVTFSVNNYSGPYAVDFGDGTSVGQVSGSTSHTYYTRGTYTASFQSDPACRHTYPQCMIATLYLGSVVVTAY